MPWVVVAADPEAAQAGSRAFADDLRRVSALALRDEAATQRVVDQPRCAEDIVCIRQVAATMGVDIVISGKMAQLGDTMLIRVLLVDARRNASQSAWQESVAHADASATTQACRSLAAPDVIVTPP